jgi:hypothetical protein
LGTGDAAGAVYTPALEIEPRLPEYWAAVETTDQVTVTGAVCCQTTEKVVLPPA